MVKNHNISWTSKVAATTWKIVGGLWNFQGGDSEALKLFGNAFKANSARWAIFARKWLDPNDPDDATTTSWKKIVLKGG